MNKKISVSVALAITIIAMTLTFSITWIVSMQVFDNTVSAVTRLQAQYAKLAEIDNYVRGNYYRDIDDDYLFDRVAMGYMNGLGDRYCVYYTEREYADMLAIENGTLVGVGIAVVRDVDGGYRIVRVHADSPAARAGVPVNASIVTVDGVDAKEYTSVTALQRALMGTDGSTLELGCVQNISEEISFSIQRIGQYTEPTVYLEMQPDKTAYIRISSFTSRTYTEFDYAVRQAQNEGATALLFDVRGNAGGRFANSYDMIDLLCPLGTIAKRQGRTGTVQVVRTSDENAVDLPMVVLVNESTSAAAELFAVSIRDLSGGQVVGTRTVGRNTMQSSPYRLSDGSAVVVTVATLLTGRDETFEGGVIPDVLAEGDGVTEELLLSPQPQIDPQIQRALQVAAAMVRERGGQPVPDVSTPGTDSSLPPSSSGTGGDESGTGGDDTGDGTSGDDPGAGDGGADDTSPDGDT